MPLEIGKEGIRAGATLKLSMDRDLEAGVEKVEVEIDSEDEEVPQVTNEG